MSTPAAEVTRAEFARMRGVDRAHITRLAQAGRIVLTKDGKKVRVAESVKLLEQTQDPSKEGVRERHADRRGELLAGELAVQDSLAGGAQQPAVAAGKPEAPPAGGADGSMMEDRRALIREQAARARLQREEIEGRLVDADQVRKATFEKARVARNALMGLVDVISSRLAAESDPSKVHDMLSTELRRVCDELAAGETDATRQ